MPKKIYLKNYKPSPYAITHCDLKFHLDEEETIVESNLKVKWKKELGKFNKQIPLELDGGNLELLEVKKDKKSLTKKEYKKTKSQLILNTDREKFSVQIKVKINPKKNTSLQGLYVSGNILCTQNEAEGFRNITYFIDKPENLSTFKTTLIADSKKYPTLLGNGELVEQKKLKDNLQSVTWKLDTPTPCYLFAIVAGDLFKIKSTYTTSITKQKKQLEIYSTCRDKERLTFAMQSLKNSMRWDEKVYGLEYELNLYMIVAVDSFNMGAMENKGLNIFNSSLLIGNEKTSTDSNLKAIDAVIAHEYFHNWSGNRVTVSNWFQLTLKEGLTVFRDQQYTSDNYSEIMKRIEDVSGLRKAQFSEDAGPLSHPIQPQSYSEMNNFYTNTVYRKGAEVVRMYQTILGKKKFNEALKYYFKKYDGMAITVNEFFECMQKFTSEDLSVFKNWYIQKGTPTVKVEEKFSKQKYSITLTQKIENDSKAKTLLIPLNYQISLDGKVLDQGQFFLKQKKQTFNFELKKTDSKPILSINNYFSSPIKVERDLDLEENLQQLENEKDLFSKWDLLQQIQKELYLNFLKTKKLNFPKKLLSIYGEFLDKEKNSEYLASLLQPLLVSDLINFTSEIDFELIQKFVTGFKKKLVKEHEKKLVAVYKQCLSGKRKYKPYQVRALKNKTLALLCEYNKDHLTLAKKQYKVSDNMTDILGAFQPVVCFDKDEKILNDFFNKWKGDNIVINHWFATQAGIDKSNVLSILNRLEKNSCYSSIEPNKVRSLIGAFIGNHFQFHHSSGRGYEWVSNRIIELDKINPQMASGLSKSAFQLYKKLSKSGQKTIYKYIKKVNEKVTSTNVKEVLEAIMK